MRKRETKRGTYLVTYKTGLKIVYGNNYKPWWQHATEFTYRRFGSKTEGWRYQDIENAITQVSYSNQPFYDVGGLKWCNLTGYQEVVDDVCRREQLVPVDVNDIVFVPAPQELETLTKELKRYW